MNKYRCEHKVVLVNHNNNIYIYPEFFCKGVVLILVHVHAVTWECLYCHWELYITIFNCNSTRVKTSFTITSYITLLLKH